MFNTQLLLACALVAILAYLVGSISFAIIVSRVGANDDVRSHGSGNAGMTNMLRNYGVKLAALTAIGDFGKGALTVLAGRWIFSLMDVTAFDGGYLAGFCVLIGHLFPLYFGFRGGKGVLTSLGVILVLNPLVFLIIVVLLVPVVFIIKIVSLTVLIGYCIFPILTGVIDYFVYNVSGSALAFEIVFALIFSGIGAFMHRENIKRIAAGKEYKFGQQKPQ